MFPIHVKTGYGIAPDSAIYYVVARNGLFLKKKNQWVDALIPINGISSLESETPYARLLLPRLPVSILGQAVSFFREVYEQSYTEVAVMIHYSEKRGYLLTVPIQTISRDSVRYDAHERIGGCLFVGTMHSHAEMDAFHSKIDHRDEAQEDGVHITIGSFYRKDCFSLDAEVVINGNRFKLGEEWFEGLRKISNEKKEDVDTFWIPWSTTSHSREFFTLDWELFNRWSVPDAWIKKLHCTPLPMDSEQLSLFTTKKMMG